MFSIETFHQTYKTESSPATINGKTITILRPVSIDQFVDNGDIMNNFPLWSKLWESAWVLANHLSSLPVEPQKTILEIGCGLGLVGIAAAMAGHRVTMSEYNADALNFARANAAINGLPEIAIEHLDWRDPQLTGRFDTIVGSDTVYDAESIGILEALFDRYLLPGGTVILADRVRRTSVFFWERMQKKYDVRAKRHVIHSDDDEIHVVLFRLERKSGQ